MSQFHTWMNPSLHYNSIVTGLVLINPASFAMPSVTGQLCLNGTQPTSGETISLNCCLSTTISRNNLFLSLFLISFREVVGSKVISVAVTPNGYADAVNGNRFVMPEERQMTFSSLLDIIEGKVESSGVFYLQKQCSNLTEELPELTGDVQTHIPWMSEALGELYMLC